MLNGSLARGGVARRWLVGSCVPLVFLAGCGGGGGSEPKPPSPADTVLQPVYVDTADYASLASNRSATLVSVGAPRALTPRLLSSTGIWSDADPDVASELSVVVQASGVSNALSLPGNLSLTLELSGLAYDSISTERMDFGPSTLSFAAAAHPVAGWTLRRFASGPMPAGETLCAAMVDPSAVGVKYAKPVYWKYREDRSHLGLYYASVLEARGAHILGVQTTPQVRAAQASDVYSGFFVGTIGAATEGVSYAFDEVSARLEVAHDAASRTVTFRALGTIKYQQNNCLMGGLSKRNVPPDELSLPWSTLSCTAHVDASTGAARCEVDFPTGNMTVVFRGHFYGPEAKEFAGTVHFIGSFNASSYDNEGITGAFVTTKEPLTP